MKQLPELSIEISGIRGRNVYQLTSRRQLVTGPSNSLDVVIQQRFVNLASPYRVRAHNSELHLMSSGSYQLLIPASGTAQRVSVRFDTKPALVGGIHGLQQGPAQYTLTRDSSGWQAKIEINETLHRRDVAFIVGHELDEIAIIVRLNPLSQAALIAQARASLFKPGSTGTITAHDRAAARELCALWEDYQYPPRGTDSYGITKRGGYASFGEGRLSRMLLAMGLDESVHIFDKLRLLRTEGAPSKLLRRIGIPGALQSYRHGTEFQNLQAKLPLLKKRGSIVDEELISHLMIPLDLGRGGFLQTGINGGHHDMQLHEFVDNHPQYVIVKEAEKIAGGVVYRKYSQYRFRGSGPKPHDKRFPKAGDAATGKYHSDWEIAQQRRQPLPKTTFSSLPSFLLAVDEAWIRWYKANTIRALSKTTNWFTIFAPFAALQITGFSQITKSGQFHLETVYVEASWF